MKIENDNDRLILICAFRYALGRMTYIPDVVSEEIINNWNSLSKHDKKLIQKEIKEAIDNNLLEWIWMLNNGKRY